MATSSVEPIKTTLLRAIMYAVNPDKTMGGLLTASFGCSIETADIEMKLTASKGRQLGNRIGYELYQNFSPEDDITPEEAFEIGKEFAEKVLKGKYEYVIATHVDKAHLHNHIIFNSVSFYDYNKYQYNVKEILRVRSANDRICRKYGLSVIENPSGVRGKGKYEYWQSKASNSWKDKLKQTIDDTIPKVSNFEEFLKFMQIEGYEIKRGKHIAFRAEGQERFTRAKRIGAAYTEEAIRERINAENVKEFESTNKGRRNDNHKYNKSNPENSFKDKVGHIIEDIDNAISKATDFDDFIQIMRNEGYEIRSGKQNQFAFKARDQKFFIRAKSLGEAYTEDAIRDRIRNSDINNTYRKTDSKKINLIIDISQNIKAQESRSYKRALEMTNINALVKTMNFLITHDIQNTDNFKEYYLTVNTEYETMREGIKQCETSIIEMSERIKFMQNYKKYYNTYKAASRADKNSEFYRAHENEIILFYAAQKYFKQRGENPYDTKISDLYTERNKLKSQKSELEKKYRNVRNQLNELRTVQKNVEGSLNIKLMEKEVQQQKDKSRDAAR